MASTSLCVAAEQSEEQDDVKNVILLIGDGMGYSQLTAARWVKSGEDLGNYSHTSLYMDGMDNAAYVTTYAADGFITDSAAAVTAIATGQKTNIGIIGQDASAVLAEKDGKKLETILEMAEKAGLATGVVSTSRITHATPAGFYSHVNDRDNEVEIANQLVASGMDVVLGGGLSYFVPKNDTTPLGGKSKRNDDRNLLDEAAALKYVVVFNSTQMDQADSNSTDMLLGLFDNSHMLYELQRANSGEPSLAQMTKKAVEILSHNDDGFFLMVEGARIDHAGHERSWDNITVDTLAFDDAVKVALDFAEASGNTLVIVTADHETGGLVLGATDPDDYRAGMSPMFTSGLTKTPGPRYDFITEAVEATHTAVDVPLMASGPQSDNFESKLDNTEIFHLMAEALGV